MFSEDSACLAISMTMDCSKHLHTLKKETKLNCLFSFFYLDDCMQSEKCPQMVLCTVIRYCSFTVCGSNNL